MHVCASDCTKTYSYNRLNSVGKGTLLAVVFCIGVLAFAIRLCLCVYFRTYEVPADADYWSFGFETGRIARALSEGWGFSSPFIERSGATAWLAPVYPAMLAGVFKIFGVYSPSAAFVAFLLNSLFASVTCIGLFCLGRAAFSTATGLFSAAVFAIYPPSIWHSINTIWDTSLLACCTVFVLYVVYTFRQRPTRANCIYLGLLMGIATLISPVLTSFYPVALFWALRAQSQPASTKFKSAIVVAVSALLIVLPWSIRNYIVLGRFVIKSNFGFELLRGNNPKTVGRYPSDDWARVHPALAAAQFARYREMTEIPFVEASQREAISFIRENWAEFLVLTARRIRLFWVGEPTQPQSWRGTIQTNANIGGLKTLLHVLPLPFAAAGLVVAYRTGALHFPFIAMLVLFPLPYYATHVTQRYRFPLEPVMILFAMYGIDAAVAAFRRNSVRPTTFAQVAVTERLDTIKQ